jgi:16S rRNA (adenine1518-N6/adenine1519-N6)-dimethyltransferase
VIEPVALPLARGHQPRKRFGQHFLVDIGIIDRLVDAIAPHEGETFLEIGPGPGALTGPLLAHLSHLQVVEIDRDLARGLRAAVPSERLTVHETDALRFDLAPLGQDLRVVGNLPYNISTPLIFHLLAQADRIRDMHFMLQKEVVDRMVADPGSSAFGRLSVMVQHRCEAVSLFEVPPDSFEPPPAVDSAIVRLVPRPLAELGDVDPRRLAEVVTAAFSHRRKTLRNALGGLVDAPALEALGIDPGLRPEALGYLDWRRIAAVASR